MSGDNGEPGDTIQLRVALPSVSPDDVVCVGLSLAFDPSVVAVVAVAPAAGIEVRDQRVRAVNDRQSVLRLRVEQTSQRGPSGTLAIVTLRAVRRGETIIEPLSLGATDRPGSSFIRIGKEFKEPEIRTVKVRVR